MLNQTPIWCTKSEFAAAQTRRAIESNSLQQDARSFTSTMRLPTTASLCLFLIPRLAYRHSFAVCAKKNDALSSVSPNNPTTSRSSKVSLKLNRLGEQSAQDETDSAVDVWEKIFNQEDADDNSIMDDSIRVVFSDVDGTLVHYPPPEQEQILPSSVVRLPPSATGMRGVISSKTFELCRSIRHDHDTKLVLVSGMRTHTLLKRVPFLPKADAYCSEAGGRIFYPVDASKAEKGQPTFQLVDFDGSKEADLQEFALQEDMEWRSKMEQDKAAGKDGYAGNELASFVEPKPVTTVLERTGALWEFARQLQERGLVLDTKGYSSCFRVNINQQPTGGPGVKVFEDLVDGKVKHPASLATSTNLGCIDFYPADSGKRNCCQYLVSKFSDSKEAPLSLERNAVCMCDDDNDLEMAMACKHAFLPGISSRSMKEMVEQHASQFTLAASEGVEETAATEKALLALLKELPGKLKP